MVIVKLNEQGEWTHRLELPDGAAIPQGYILHDGQTKAPDAWQDYRIAIDSGCEVAPGIVLSLQDEDRQMFTSFIVLIQLAIQMGVMADDQAPVSFADINGTLHTTTAATFLGYMLTYGFHFQTLWTTAKTSVPQS